MFAATTDRLATCNPRFPHRFRFIHSARLVAAAALCAGVAGCSAQNRQTAAIEPTPAPAPVATEAQPPVGPVEKVAAAAKTVTQPIVNAASAVKSYFVADRSGAKRKPGPAGQGLASWYGGDFHGRRTANGETFDMAGFTAAHPTMPLPSYVRVTNVSNGRSVVVRVNDRGPYHKGRMIDVSKRTADVLGFRGAGVGNVKLDYIGLAPVNARDDRKLIATYQEFGRPAAPEGVQVASLKRITDTDLMNEIGGVPAPDIMVASAAPVVQPTIQAHPVAETEQVALAMRPTIAAPSAKPAAAKPVAAEPELASVGLVKPVQIARATPSSPIVVTPVAPKPTAAPAHAETPKRVVQPSEPELASMLPAAKPAAAAPADTANVASRIASSFDSFGAAAFAPGAARAAPQSATAYSNFR